MDQNLDLQKRNRKAKGSFQWSSITALYHDPGDTKVSLNVLQDAKVHCDEK